MKKRIIKWSIIVASIISICALICAIKYWRGRWIPASQVEKVEFQGFHSCSGPISDTVELNEREIRRLVRHFNAAINRGRVTAEGCDSAFSFTIYLEDGTKIYLRSAMGLKLEVNPPEGDKYWISNPFLTRYAAKLVKKYELMADPS